MRSMLAAIMTADTIVHRLFNHERERGHVPALYEKRDGAWQAIRYAAYAETVRRVGRALISLGMEPGGVVSILGFNRPEWAYMAVGAMAVGGAAAGIYTTSSPSEVAYIARHSESLVILCENEAQWRKVESELGSLPALARVVMYRGVPAITHDKVLSWEAFLALGDAVPEDRVRERADALAPDGLACLIYTSGTTGPPKGVMLSHRNLAFVASLAERVMHVNEADSALSYLPLSHIAEQVFSIHVPITCAASVFFAESLERVPDNLKEVQPTIFFGVPRIWEKFHAGIDGKASEAKGVKKHMLAWARKVGRRVTDIKNTGAEPTGLLAAEYKIASKLVFQKLKTAIGLGRARICISGAAPISKEILEFFGTLDIIVMEVYGQSEDTGPTSCNLPGRTRFGTVGPPFDGIDVKIADDGEILVSGPNVFLGYYKEPEATAETLIDGWLHSGDLGAIDADGFLSITGRKKEILITAGGKNISPKNIEAALKNDPLVGEAVVIGDRRKYLTVLVTLEPDATKKFAAERGIDEKGIGGHPALRARLQETVDRVNVDLARVETVKKFTVLDAPFSVESGELTPTLKLKRRVINEKYATQIEAMYVE